MAHSARAPEEAAQFTFGDAVGALLGVIARNPTLVGGSTAFLVALSFVSANALWYQPYAHSGAFFATRDFVRSDKMVPLDETTIRIERQDEIESPQIELNRVEGDATVKSVQKILGELRYYDGDIDGVYGPNTKMAIEAYQDKMGLDVTGAVDETLLDQLGIGSVTHLPSPAPRQIPTDERAAPATSGAAERDERVASIQSGLREFGNESIQVDGRVGAKTKAAILEFQSLFGLPETGEADAAVLAKMKEIGLIE
ncbi:MAG: peptidoglycan-binding protein [Mesorhizobium sp.]|nr:peptidoglycan-binding protein [Mesorhizobium sp.]